MCTVSYVLNKDIIRNNKNLFDCDLVADLIPKSRSIDIDDKYDLEIARFLYGKKF